MSVSSANPDAKSETKPSLLLGQISLFTGVVLLGLSLRHAITAVSPLLSTIDADIGLGTTGATILGMLPTIAFGLAGFTAPAIIRRLGLPLTVVVALTWERPALCFGSSATHRLFS